MTGVIQIKSDNPNERTHVLNTSPSIDIIKRDLLASYACYHEVLNLFSNVKLKGIKEAVFNGIELCEATKNHLMNENGRERRDVVINFHEIFNDYRDVKKENIILKGHVPTIFVDSTMAVSFLIVQKIRNMQPNAELSARGREFMSMIDKLSADNFESVNISNNEIREYYKKTALKADHIAEKMEKTLNETQENIQKIDDEIARISQNEDILAEKIEKREKEVKRFTSRVERMIEKNFSSFSKMKVSMFDILNMKNSRQGIYDTVRNNLSSSNILDHWGGKIDLGSSDVRVLTSNKRAIAKETEKLESERAIHLQSLREMQKLHREQETVIEDIQDYQRNPSLFEEGYNNIQSNSIEMRVENDLFFIHRFKNIKDYESFRSQANGLKRVNNLLDAYECKFENDGSYKNNLPDNSFVGVVLRGGTIQERHENGFLEISEANPAGFFLNCDIFLDKNVPLNKELLIACDYMFKKVNSELKQNGKREFPVWVLINGSVLELSVDALNYKEIMQGNLKEVFQPQDAEVFIKDVFAGKSVGSSKGFIQDEPEPVKVLKKPIAPPIVETNWLDKVENLKEKFYNGSERFGHSKLRIN